MAINLATLKTRSLTALIFVAVMLSGLLWNEWSFLTLFTLVHFGCWIEFNKILKKIYIKNHLVYLLFGLPYITLPILMLIDLRMNWTGLDISKITVGIILPLLIIFSIWINDTMAYLVGSLIGKTPFSPISPKKTWEGTIGGAVLCVLIIGFGFPILIANFFEVSLQNSCFVIAAICAVFGTLGDLLESKLKRLANIKDSGSIMPGHGGFLDRFDSLLIATPFVWLYLKLFL
jgi:phosphatidate cytidylyltransferase